MDADFVVRSSASSSSSSQSIPSSSMSSSTEPELCLSVSPFVVVFPLESGAAVVLTFNSDEPNFVLLRWLLLMVADVTLSLLLLTSSPVLGDGLVLSDLIESVGVIEGAGRGVLEWELGVLFSLSNGMDDPFGEPNGGGVNVNNEEPPPLLLPALFRPRFISGLVGPTANCFKRCE